MLPLMRWRAQSTSSKWGWVVVILTRHCSVSCETDMWKISTNGLRKHSSADINGKQNKKLLSGVNIARTLERNDTNNWITIKTFFFFFIIPSNLKQIWWNTHSYQGSRKYTGYCISSRSPAKAFQVGVIEMDGCWIGKRSLIVTSQMRL